MNPSILRIKLQSVFLGGEMEREGNFNPGIYVESELHNTYRRDQMSLKCRVENTLFRSEIETSSTSISAFVLSAASKLPVTSAGCASKIHPSSFHFSPSLLLPPWSKSP